MKRWIILVLCLLQIVFVDAQQLPMYTQTMPTGFLINPGIAGTKKTLDLRMGYRNQWTGFSGAPVSEFFTINSRLSGGKVGLGASAFKDDIGPVTRMNYSGSLAGHIRFPDVECSIGITASLNQYKVNSSKITIEDPTDVVINSSALKSANAPDLGGGIYIYNDRFHFGLSMMSMLKSKVELYKAGKFKTTTTTFDPHLYVSLGYNFSGNPDYVWENNVLANYVKGAPFSIGYSLRLYYQSKLIMGTSVRFGDAVALHGGFILSKQLQISYSYDFITSKLRQNFNGSHEVVLAYSASARKKKRKVNEEFQNQKYGYMF